MGQDSQEHITPIREFDVAGALPGGRAQEAYRRDGVVCLRNAHDKAWLSLIEAGIDEALSGGSQDIDIVDKAQDAGRFSFSS
ncbi:MAG: hypothetical protein ABGY05_00265, partial [Pseudomonadota bacterium]